MQSYTCLSASSQYVFIHALIHVLKNNVCQDTSPSPLPARQPSWGKASSLLTFRDHTQTHYIRLDSPGRGIGPSQRPLPDSTQQTQETDIQAPGGIPTHNPSKERPQTQALDRTATVIGSGYLSLYNKWVWAGH